MILHLHFKSYSTFAPTSDKSYLVQARQMMSILPRLWSDFKYPKPKSLNLEIKFFDDEEDLLHFARTHVSNFM